MLCEDKPTLNVADLVSPDSSTIYDNEGNITNLYVKHTYNNDMFLFEELESGKYILWIYV